MTNDFDYLSPQPKMTVLDLMLNNKNKISVIKT